MSQRRSRLRAGRTGYGSRVGAVIAVLGVLAVAVTIAAFVLTRKHPENATADSPGDPGGTEFFGDVTDRPAGPGAEADGVPERGSPAPGPSAESLPPTSGQGEGG